MGYNPEHQAAPVSVRGWRSDTVWSARWLPARSVDGAAEPSLGTALHHTQPGTTVSAVRRWALHRWASSQATRRRTGRSRGAEGDTTTKGHLGPRTGRARGEWKCKETDRRWFASGTEAAW